MRIQRESWKEERNRATWPREGTLKFHMERNTKHKQVFWDHGWEVAQIEVSLGGNICLAHSKIHQVSVLSFTASRLGNATVIIISLIRNIY